MVIATTCEEFSMDYENKYKEKLKDLAVFYNEKLRGEETNV